MLEALDADAVRRWAVACVDELTREQAAIDEINVFPVPDGDTGTNLLHTMRAALDAVSREDAAAREESSQDATSAGAGSRAAVGAVFAALAKGALRGARGNSGVIVSQALRGIAETLRDTGGAGADELTAAFRRADELATAAVADPAPGTMLSVLHAAAEAARATWADSLDTVSLDVGTLAAVVTAAARAAAVALADTPRQLAVLATAGVVDAGGRGLVVLFDALARVVTDTDPVAPLTSSAARVPVVAVGANGLFPESTPEPHTDPDGDFPYEVMYLLDGSDAARVDALRGRLRGLGDCVSVVGDGLTVGVPGASALWTVHVHCADVGAAIEVGIEAGRPHRIRVTRFADTPAAEPARFVRDRAVVAVVRGTGTAELLRGEGATVIAAPVRASDLLAAITGTRAEHVVLLPNDADLTAEAEAAAEQAVAGGQDVVVVPTASPVQGLAAIAVHDANRRPSDDVVAMAEAAAATRRGELLVGENEALTWVGLCQPGDLLGMLDGEVVLIEPADADVSGPELVIGAARKLIDLLLGVSGELVTALVGADAPAGLADELEEHMRREHPEVEFVAYQGAEPDTLLLLGVE